MSLIKKILEFFKGKKQEAVNEVIEEKQEIVIVKPEVVEIAHENAEVIQISDLKPHKTKQVKRTAKAKSRKKANIKKRTSCGKKPQTNRRSNRRR